MANEFTSRNQQYLQNRGICPIKKAYFNCTNAKSQIKELHITKATVCFFI